MSNQIPEVCIHPFCDENLNEPFQQGRTHSEHAGLCRRHYQILPFQPIGIRLLPSHQAKFPDDFEAALKDAIKYFHESMDQFDSQMKHLTGKG